MRRRLSGPRIGTLDAIDETLIAGYDVLDRFSEDQQLSVLLLTEEDLAAEWRTRGPRLVALAERRRLPRPLWAEELVAELDEGRS
jgi:hypothetical protein